MIQQGKLFSVLCLLTLLFQANGSYAQYTSAEEAKAFINDRLSHSLLQKIDPDGTVTMNAPDEKIKFNLRDVNFNYNGGNNDDRVRVFCDNCIEHYDHKILSERTSRQSFLCESEKEANEVIGAFRYLKKKYTSDQKGAVSGNRPLKISDSSFNAKTVAEAIDFVNENLSYSMITHIDDQGLMTINAPDEIYQVDLKKAEFGYNDASDGSKVRIYGDFCIALKKSSGGKELISRKSFQTSGRVKAYKAISVLYFLKGTYTELDPARSAMLKNPGVARVTTYSTVDEAIRFINARLSYSIILSIDPSGNTVINAPEEIYRFNLTEVKLSTALNHQSRSEWFPFIITDGPSTGVLAECSNCIKKYEDKEAFGRLDEQVFQCANTADAKEVLKAFTFIKGKLKK